MNEGNQGLSGLQQVYAFLIGRRARRLAIQPSGSGGHNAAQGQVEEEPVKGAAVGETASARWVQEVETR